MFVTGVTLLFNEPPDACKPDVRWRLYVFKAGEVLNGNCYEWISVFKSNHILLEAHA